MKHFVFLLLMSAIYAAPKGHAQDIGEIDADVEESISDSEAAKAQAKEAKERRDKERADTVQMRKEAEKLRAAAAAKKDEARGQLRKLDEEYRAFKTEQTTLTKHMEKYNKDIAYAETSIQNAQAKNEKKKGEIAALQQLKSEKLAKVAELDKKHKETALETTTINQSLALAKADLAKATTQEKAASAKLEALRQEQARQKAAVAAQVQALKVKYKASQDKTTTIENQIRALREKTAQSDTETKMAESEVQQADARLKDAQERLADVSQRSAEKEAELAKRKADANSKLHSSARESEEARLKMDQAKAEQSLNRAMAASDTAPLHVQMQNKSSKMTLNKDCRVYDQSGGKGALLGMKKSGSTVWNGKVSGDWVSFPLKAGRTGWVAKSCF